MKKLIQNQAFVLRNVEDVYLLVACSENSLNKWVISLNHTAVDIWKLASDTGIKKTELMETLRKMYKIDEGSREYIVLDQFVKQLIVNEIFLEVEKND